MNAKYQPIKESKERIKECVEQTKACILVFEHNGMVATTGFNVTPQTAIEILEQTIERLKKETQGWNLPRLQDNN